MRKCLFSILVAIGIGAPMVLAEPTHVKFSLAGPPDAPPSKGAAILAKELAAANLMQLDLLPAGAIAPAFEMPDRVKSRVVDMALVPTSALVKINSAFGIFSLPFAFEDLGAVARFQESDEGKKLLQSLEKAGLKGLAYWPIEMVQLFSQKPVKQADDLKGMKVASTGGGLATSVIQDLGATPLTLRAGELSAALERGVADASATTPSFAETLKLPQHQKYLNYTNQQYQGSVLVANLSFWNALKPDVQTAMQALVGKVTPQVDQFAIEQSANKIGMLNKGGLQLVVPDTSAFKAWRAAASKAWLANGGDTQILKVAGGAEGGGDTCGPGLCRCPQRTCSAGCCRGGR